MSGSTWESSLMFGLSFANDDGSTTADKEMAREENRRRASCHSVALRS
jgi:hypothetical protein